jgi:hypothetical protein
MEFFLTKERQNDMNMNGEYKTELRQIVRLKVKAMKDLAAYCRTLDRAIEKLNREKIKAKDRVHAQFQKWSKREAILQGRLS